MAEIKTTIPDDLEIRIQRLVEDGEFVSFDEAVQELISSGLTAYRTGDAREFEPDDFEQDHNDDYVF